MITKMVNIVDLQRCYRTEGVDHSAPLSDFMDPEGKRLFFSQVLWAKHPNVPCVIVDCYSRNKSGYKNIRDFLCKELKNLEDPIYILWEKGRITILLPDLESYCAFKLKFQGSRDISFHDQLSL